MISYEEADDDAAAPAHDDDKDVHFDEDKKHDEDNANGNENESLSDSARIMAQSSFASPGGNVARCVICTRPSKFT